MEPGGAEPESRAYEDREEATAELERELGYAIGSLAIRFERLTHSLQILIVELCAVEVADIETAVMELRPKLDALVGHLPFKGLVFSLEALWNRTQLGAPFDGALRRQLLALEETRNEMVHASWWADDPPNATRTRFQRRRSETEHEEFALTQILAVSSELATVDRRLWELHAEIEGASFRYRDAIYGDTAPAYSIYSSEAFGAFIRSFPDVRVETVTDWRGPGRPSHLTVTFAHPFGRRAWSLFGDWVDELDPDEFTDPTRNVVRAILQQVEERHQPE